MSLSAIRHRGPARVETTIAESAARVRPGVAMRVRCVGALASERGGHDETGGGGMESLTFFREELGGDVLFRAEVRDGVAVLTYVDPHVRNDVRKWFERGLHEYVGPRFEEEPRTTMPDEPEFLERLRRYVQGQFRFPCEHVVSRCGDPTRARPWQDLPGPRRFMPGVYHAWGDRRRPRCDAVRCAVVRPKGCEVT